MSKIEEIREYKKNWMRKYRALYGNVHYYKNREKYKDSAMARYEEIKKDPAKYDALKKKRNLRTRNWSLRNVEKRKAHQAVFVSLRNGTLKKKPCKVCKVEKVEAHHEDYSKPLKVIWLCKKHHIEADIKLRSISTGF